MAKVRNGFARLLGDSADNIALGKPDASRAEIQAAAAAIGAATFIEALPDGYDSEVGKRSIAARRALADYFRGNKAMKAGHADHDTAAVCAALGS